MGEKEPGRLSSPIIGPEEQYWRKPERLDNALLVAAVVVIIAAIVGFLVFVTFFNPFPDW